MKQEKGPWTNAEEVEEFMAKEISEKEKQARLKKEMKFARDSSTTLPKVDSLFKIQVCNSKSHVKLSALYSPHILTTGDTAK